MVQKAKNSAWDSSDNIYVGTVADLIALPEKAREGVVILSGHTSIGDGGGGMFVYRASVPRSNHNNGTIIDPTGTGTGNGCWIRVYSLNTGSLAWFGSNDSTVNNLLSAYGIEGLIVSITEGTYAGTFQFKTAEIANHDAVNNFNGWVRLNDVNFTQNLKMNGHKITGCARAQGNSDVPTLEQVVELVQTGDYIGIVPIYADRVEGDGITVVYLTPASEQVTPPPVNLISGPSFEVTVDGIKKRHVIDFTINIDDQDPDYGKLTWEPGSIPQVGEQVDIVWFAPIIVDALLGSVVTATESAVAHTLEEWFGEYGADIIVKATGTTGFRSLGDRFADVPAYFDHIAGMIAGYALYKPGMLAIVKGTTIAGDGFIGTYFIKTQAQADIDGDDYTSPGTFNVAIPGPSWVAVYQKNEPHVLQVEQHELTSGQTSVVFSNEVDYAYFHIHGDSVDDARLIKNIDYTLAGDRKTVTLLESYPEGTVLMANWYEPEFAEDPNTVEVYEDGVLVGSAPKINFRGSQVNCNLNGDTIDVFIPGVVLEGAGSISPSVGTEGTPIIGPTLSWSWEPAGVPITSQTVISATHGSIPVDPDDTSIVIMQTFTENDIITISGVSDFGSFDIEVALQFNRKIFFGRNANASLTEGEVLALGSIEDTTQEQEYNFSAGAGYIWIVYPQSMGLLTRWDNANSPLDIVTEGSVQILSAFDPGTGVSSNYYAQRSAFELASALTVITSK